MEFYHFTITYFTLIQIRNLIIELPRNVGKCLVSLENVTKSNCVVSVTHYLLELKYVPYVEFAFPSILSMTLAHKMHSICHCLWCCTARCVYFPAFRPPSVTRLDTHNSAVFACLRFNSKHMRYAFHFNIQLFQIQYALCWVHCVCIVFGTCKTNKFCCVRACFICRTPLSFLPISWKWRISGFLFVIYCASFDSDRLLIDSNTDKIYIISNLFNVQASKFMGLVWLETKRWKAWDNC